MCDHRFTRIASTGDSFWQTGRRCVACNAITVPCVHLRRTTRRVDPFLNVTTCEDCDAQVYAHQVNVFCRHEEWRLVDELPDGRLMFCSGCGEADVVKWREDDPRVAQAMAQLLRFGREMNRSASAAMVEE